MIYALLLIFSFLPIWRRPPEEGLTFWEFAYKSFVGTERKHIHITEAVAKAKDAYRQKYYYSPTYSQLPANLEKRVAR